eukprot:7383087-Prymnesium_polylepis.2
MRCGLVKRGLIRAPRGAQMGCPNLRIPPIVASPRDLEGCYKCSCSTPRGDLYCIRSDLYNVTRSYPPSAGLRCASARSAARSPSRAPASYASSSAPRAADEFCARHARRVNWANAAASTVAVV